LTSSADGLRSAAVVEPLQSRKEETRMAPDDREFIAFCVWMGLIAVAFIVLVVGVLMRG